MFIPRRSGSRSWRSSLEHLRPFQRNTRDQQPPSRTHEPARHVQSVVGVGESRMNRVREVSRIMHRHQVLRSTRSRTPLLRRLAAYKTPIERVDAFGAGDRHRTRHDLEDRTIRRHRTAHHCDLYGRPGVLYPPYEIVARAAARLQRISLERTSGAAGEAHFQSFLLRYISRGGRRREPKAVVPRPARSNSEPCSNHLYHGQAAGPRGFVVSYPGFRMSRSPGFLIAPGFLIPPVSFALRSVCSPCTPGFRMLPAGFGKPSRSNTPLFWVR